MIRNSSRDYGTRKMRFAITTLTAIIVSLLILTTNHAMAQTMPKLAQTVKISSLEAANTTRIAFFNNSLFIDKADRIAL